MSEWNAGDWLFGGMAAVISLALIFHGIGDYLGVSSLTDLKNKLTKLRRQK